MTYKMNSESVFNPSFEELCFALMRSPRLTGCQTARMNQSFSFFPLLFFFFFFFFLHQNYLLHLWPELSFSQTSAQNVRLPSQYACLLLLTLIISVSKQLLYTCVKQNASTLCQMALARMLVIVSIIFVLTSSPIVILGITQSIVDDFFINRRYNYILLLYHTIYMELGKLNCRGINFFVYVLRSSRFREELARLACFRFLKHKKIELKKRDVTVKTVRT